MDVFVVQDPRLLHSTSVIQVAAGFIGAGAAGAANDTRLYSVTILKNGSAVTLTLGGFRGEDGIARNVVLTGSTTVDTQYTFPGLKNSAGPMTLTASAADVVLVGVMPG